LARGGITAVLPAQTALENALVAVECFGDDQHIGRHRRQEVICTHEVVRLAAGQEEADRVAQRVGQCIGSWCSARRASVRSPGPPGLFLGADAMLMGAHNGTVYRRLLVVGIGYEMLKYPLPHTAFGLTAEA
jgi:hypothetical protein